MVVAGVVFLGRKLGLKLGRFGLKYSFLSVVDLGVSVVYTLFVLKVRGTALEVIIFFFKSTGTFCALVAVKRDFEGLNDVLLVLGLRFDITAAFIFFTVLGAILGLVKLDDLIIGRLENENLDRLVSTGDVLVVVVSSTIASVVVKDSVVTFVDSVVVSKSKIGLVAVSVIVVVVCEISENVVTGVDSVELT